MRRAVKDSQALSISVTSDNITSSITLSDIFMFYALCFYITLLFLIQLHNCHTNKNELNIELYYYLQHLLLMVKPSVVVGHSSK